MRHLFNLPRCAFGLGQAAFLIIGGLSGSCVFTASSDIDRSLSLVTFLASLAMVLILPCIHERLTDVLPQDRR